MENHILRNNKTEHEMLLEYAVKKGFQNYHILETDIKNIKINDIIVIEIACYDDLSPYCMRIDKIVYEQQFIILGIWVFDYNKKVVFLRNIN